jgi:phosphoglycolate phosphatase-like HAD superfamily hydrolase
MQMRLAGELFVGRRMSPADKSKVVHAFDVDDTLTKKPDGFDNAGMTKDQFFDAARNFPPDSAVVELAQMLHSKGDAIGIATARPAERLQETIDWLNRHNIPFDSIMLSNGKEPSGIAKQEMLQQLQNDYRMVGTLFDDSPYNIHGAQLQGIDAVHLAKNDDYWAAHPEKVFKI